MISPGFPGRPLRWLPTFVDRVVEGFRGLDRETASWTAMGLYATVVAAMHFGGIRLNVYTTVHWWDLLTHVLSGIGVAALLQLTFSGPNDPVRPTTWLFPAVLAFGAGFEVYEFVFKDFWYGWPFGYYLVDTVVDLVAGAAGGALVVVTTAAHRRLVSGSPRGRPTNPE